VDKAFDKWVARMQLFSLRDIIIFSIEENRLKTDGKLPKPGKV